MDRTFVYPGELPRVEDFMGFEKQAYYGLGRMIRAAIGPNTGISNGDFQISATGPASMSVIIGTGSIYASQTVDASAFGVLGTDANVIMKQGILNTPQTLTITAPSTSGFSQYYLVQVGFNEADGNAVVPPFLNSSNPSVPWNGANNTGAALNTTRADQAVVSLVAGTAAATGSQTIPAPSAGSIPLWVILVSNSTTTITASNWFVSPQAPFFPYLEQLTSLFQRILPTSTTFFINNSTGSDTNGNGLTPTTAWASLSFALSVIATYNLNGNTVTVQLANTGILYTGPGTFEAPSNGTLIILGDPANQALYRVDLSPSAGDGVIVITGGNVSLVGIQVANTSTSGASGCVGASGAASLTLTNVTLTTTGSTSSALLSASSGGSITVLSGCIMGGAAANCWAAESSGSIVQGANVATVGPPAFASAFAFASVGGSINQSTTGWSWTGAGATGPRFLATINGAINSSTGTPNSFWPGSSNGSTSSGGQSL